MLTFPFIKGIKATFLTDYVHTVIIFVIIFVFAFSAYATNEVIGSPGKVYDLLVEAAEDHPVEGNAGGSYLTMQSKEGAIFFVINIVGNFGTVFLDNGYVIFCNYGQPEHKCQATKAAFLAAKIELTNLLFHRYYNKAIAASPVSALPGYVMGGLSWFAIPWLCATTMGLAALALEGNPVFPTYPNRMSNLDVTAGLVLPNAAVALLGKGGAAATFLLIFMHVSLFRFQLPKSLTENRAVTSASSAELIAVSSIWTYDIYQTYIKPTVLPTSSTQSFR